jgi:TetR/AcrR family transcriptional repressor of nem operon
LARPREFDETAVLEAAMRCFWSRGYEATSVHDLAAGTGLTAASLYNAFGDKRSLYRHALEHYLKQSVRERIKRLETTLPPFPSIRAFFDEIIERSVKDRERRGCMLVNSALEVAPHDASFRQTISRELMAIEAFFRRRIVAGQRDGSIAARQPADDLARLLLSVLLGIRVLARTRPNRDLLEASASAGLAALADVPANATRPRHRRPMQSRSASPRDASA